MEKHTEEILADVYDEAELAEIAERRERDAGIHEVRSRVFQGTRAEAEALVDANKECDECGVLIPVARQLARPNTKYCVDCQQWHDDQAARKRKMTGNTITGLFG
jgi:RNA polymerase-binding transcription factor DksA